MFRQPGKQATARLPVFERGQSAKRTVTSKRGGGKTLARTFQHQEARQDSRERGKDRRYYEKKRERKGAEIFCFPEKGGESGTLLGEGPVEEDLYQVGKRGGGRERCDEKQFIL